MSETMNTAETPEESPTKSQLIAERDEARQWAARYIKAVGMCIDCDGKGCENCAHSGYEAVSPKHPQWLLDLVRRKQSAPPSGEE